MKTFPARLLALLFSLLLTNCSCVGVGASLMPSGTSAKDLVCGSVLVSSIDGKTYGSGTIVKHGDKVYVVTAEHVVDDAVDSGIPFMTIIASCPATSSVVVPILVTDDEADVAIMELPEDSHLAPYALSVGRRDPRVGNTLRVLGFPGGPRRGGAVASLSSGVLSRYSHREGKPVFYSDAPIYRGSSGGGAFDARGRLVGVATSFEFDSERNNVIPGGFIFSARMNIVELFEFMDEG